MTKKISLLLFCLFLLATLVFFLQPKTFTLVVKNNSPHMVEKVAVFGSALELDGWLVNLEPGSQQALSMTIARQGGLKYEVHQGMTRVDSVISRDVATLTAFKQQLVIESDNRFLLSPLP
ncbi:hypothetical protein [Oceanicoccus sp. KOV_DT_Chl]|uniref:hypothetical protein n=1 Tax=Oceanicoccus sp. KOV_DT_Chl TaxID=1904639 RepID=UPI000C7E687A|nr:hypothetical protein [Oceanicoccus sp. KOV_DT_Chl]